MTASTCARPGTFSQRQATCKPFGSTTPYYEYFLYVGGSTAYCPGPQSGITTSWISAVVGEGWGLVGLWVGPQCCGTASSTVISTNTTTAQSQGVAEADKAANQWCAWDLCYGLPEPLVYDFEGDSDPTAEHAFLSGWDKELENRLFAAGAYAATNNPSSEVQNWKSVTPVPEFVGAAAWNDVNSAWNIPYLSNSYWAFDQRYHQYDSSHYERYNGVTMYVDNDCANSPVFGSLASYGDSSSDTEQAGYAEDPQYCPP